MLFEILANSFEGLVGWMRRPGPRLRLTGGYVVLPSGVVQADLVLNEGCIVAIGDRPAVGGQAEVVDVANLLIFPGLINAHDHLEFNCFPRLGEPLGYTNFYQWAEDIHRQHGASMQRALEIPFEERLLAGGYKNLFSGVTTVCHHNPYQSLFDRAFPVRVVENYRWSHSLDFGEDVVGTYDDTPPDVPWIIHLAEGTDDTARSEFPRLAEMGCLGANTVIVHGVALSEADVDLMAQCGAGLIWCPSSNLFMFGRTAPIKYLTQRITVALGSDSRLSGSDDLLAELGVARELGVADDEELFRMVTGDAARLLRVDDELGVIELGKRADLLILVGDPDRPYRSLVTGGRQAIRLVLLGGRPAFGTAGFAALFRSGGRPFSQIHLDGQPYLVAGDPDRVRYRRHLR